MPNTIIISLTTRAITVDKMSQAATVATVEAATESYALTGSSCSFNATGSCGSFLVDSYGTRVFDVQLSKTDGTRLRGSVTVSHNGTTSADATTATAYESFFGSSTDIGAFTAVLSGAGTSQICTLTLAGTFGTGAWTARILAVPMKGA